MQQHYPYGNKLYAFEKNILKYRSLEMILVLFYVEEIKRHSYAFATCPLNNYFNSTFNKKIFADLHQGNKYNKVWKQLIACSILSEDESKEIQDLITYRNDIGHRIHELLYDFDHSSSSQLTKEFRGIKYNYESRRRLKYWVDELSNRIRKKGPVEMYPMERMSFGVAKKNLEDELFKLNRRINQQVKSHNKFINSLNSEMITAYKLFPDVDFSYPFTYKRSNGQLNQQGVEMCFKLFDHHISIMATAYLMRISYRSSSNQYKRWQCQTSKMGGKE